MKPFLDVVKGITYRNVRSMRARPVVTLIPFVIPLIFFATFAGGFSSFGNTGAFRAEFPGSYVSFQFVFVWLQGSAFQGMFSGFLIARDFESGWAKRLMLAAPNRLGIVGGYIASALLRGALGAVVIFAVGFIAGMRAQGNVLEVIGLVLLGFTLTAVCGLWAAGVALRFRTIQAGPLIQMPIFVVLFLSPVFLPVAALQGWIKGAAKVNPFSIFMEEGRNLLAGNDPRATFLFAVALGVLFLGTFWAVRGLRSAERAG